MLTFNFFLNEIDWILRRSKWLGTKIGAQNVAANCVTYAEQEILTSRNTNEFKPRPASSTRLTSLRSLSRLSGRRCSSDFIQ